MKSILFPKFFHAAWWSYHQILPSPGDTLQKTMEAVIVACFISLLYSTKVFLKTLKLAASVLPWSHWHLLTESLLQLSPHLLSCQESILQAPGRHRIKAFHHGCFRNQAEKHTSRTLLAIVSVYKCSDGEGRKWRESVFPLQQNRRTAGQGRFNPTKFFIPFGVCREFWCLILKVVFRNTFPKQCYSHM